MRRALAAVCAALLWTPVGAVAEVAETVGGVDVDSAGAESGADAEFPIQIGGDFFTRFETRRNYASPGVTISAEDYFRYRAKMILKTAHLEVAKGFTLQAVMAPQTGGFLGVGGDDLVDAVLGLHEGYVALAAPGFRFDFGRFEMSYGDELVIGTVAWHHLGRAFDGLRAHAEFGDKGPWLDVFVTMLIEGFTSTPQVGEDFGAGDSYFLGAYAGLGPLLGEGFDLDLYLFARLAPETTEAGATIKETTEMTFGARHKGLVADKLLDYRVEAGVQVGRRGGVDALGFHGNAEIGLGFLENRAFRVAVEGLFASGDDGGTADKDEGWFQLFPTAHKWLGYSDFIGPRTNIAGAVLHVAYAPIPVLKIMLDGHMFFRPEKGKTEDGYQGTEIDLGILWKPGKIFGLRCGYALFLPDSDVSDDLLHFAELELRATF